VEYFESTCKPVIDSRFELQLYHERKSPLEILECQRAKAENFGSMPRVRMSKYGVRFRRQLYIVGARQVTLYLRDKRGVIADLVINIGKGLVLGLTYLDIGHQAAQGQLAFYFMLMMATSIDGMKGMSKLIADRRVMKMETSEALYNEWAYIIPFTVISWIQAIMANTVFMLIIFSVSSLQWPLFGSLWIWTTMLYLTMDAMFLMLSAIAKDASTAFVMALPFFMLFLLFNGFTVNRATAPWYLVWIVNMSPVAYAIECATMAAKRFYGTADYAVIASIFGYRDEPGTAFAVMLLVMTTFRILQVAALKFLNNIQR